MNNAIYGTLNDEDIINAANNGNLIVENFKVENVKQACYELRAGNTYFDLSSEEKKHTAKSGGAILFKPHQTIVIISEEKFSLPNDILARFLTKGALFSVGFTPINTYADPGFYGRMGIVMTNASNNYLKINSGDVIAKVEFDRLYSPVITPYRGQHGFETGIWPIKNDYIVTPQELNKYLSTYDELDEIEVSYGKTVSKILRRILITERRFIFATTILIIVNLLFIGLTAGSEWWNPITNVIVGIITNIIYALISLAINNYKFKKGDKK